MNYMNYIGLNGALIVHFHNIMKVKVSEVAGRSVAQASF